MRGMSYINNCLEKAHLAEVDNAAVCNSWRNCRGDKRENHKFEFEVPLQQQQLAAVQPIAYRAAAAVKFISLYLACRCTQNIPPR